MSRAAETTDEVIYRRLAPELIRFATALVGPGDAADVMSAAVVKALASPSWPDVTEHRPYLYRKVLHD
jgi:DNA-directed RNA polymerase specialized sigma24 family protein